MLPPLVLFPSLLLFLPPLVRPSSIPVSFCCPEFQVARLKKTQSLLLFGKDRLATECVPLREEFGDMSPPSIHGVVVTAVDTSKDVGDPARLQSLDIGESEERVEDCPFGAKEIYFKIDITDVQERRPMDNIELRGSERAGDHEGYVIINGKPICDDGFDESEANVACRMLGYNSGTVKNDFGRSKWGSTFIMDDLRCDGNERTLFDCPYNRNDDCSEEEIAGVICAGNSNTSLSLEGALLLPDNMSRIEVGGVMVDRLEPSTFCITSGGLGDLKAIVCEARDSAPILRSLTDLGWGHATRPFTCYDHCEGPKRIQGELYAVWLHHFNWAERNYLNMMDTDKSRSATKEEWDRFFDENIATIFQILDQDGNYQLQAPAEANMFNNMPFKLFDAALVKLFEWLDYSEDNALGFNEDMMWREDPREDRNGDGMITLEELTFSPPITWPASLYKLYTMMDPNKDEKLSFEEARNFLTRTFAVIDEDKDCKLSIKEIVDVAKDVGLPRSNALAIKLIVQQYATILNYLFTQIIKKADVHERGFVTLAEIKNISDWDWADSMALTVASVGYPNMGPIYHLQGNDIFSRRREGFEKQMEVLLTALMNLLEKPVYTEDIQPLCGNFAFDPKLLD